MFLAAFVLFHSTLHADGVSTKCCNECVWLFVCWLTYLKNRKNELHQMFDARCRWPCYSPPLHAKWHPSVLWTTSCFNVYKIFSPKVCASTVQLMQNCPRVHFVWPDPTQPISWLTQPNPPKTEKSRPDAWLNATDVQVWADNQIDKLSTIDDRGQTDRVSGAVIIANPKVK